MAEQTPSLKSLKGEPLKQRSLPDRLLDFLDKYFINKFGNLWPILTLVASWLALVALIGLVLVWQLQGLLPYYTYWEPRAGGVYNEGVVGSLTNLNPLYATTEVDQVGSNLIFSGLFKYNQQNELVADLASGLTTDDERASYTVTLKKDLYWHDGQILDAQDVVFTIQTIQNPAAQSPLYNNWQGVVVHQIDDWQVKFNLPYGFSSFPNLLTVGILPQHLLGDHSANEIRNLDFNYQPIGSGPFKFANLVASQTKDSLTGELKLQLEPYEDYHGQKPRLDGIVIWAIPNRQRLTDLFNAGVLSGASGLIEADLTLLPQDYQKTDFNLMGGVYLFYKQNNSILQDKDLRKAISQAINLRQALATLDRPVVRLFGPLLPEHLGYDPQVRPPVFSQEQATSLLAQNWQLVDGRWQGPSGPLSLKMTAPIETDYALVATEICQQLTDFGLNCQLDLRPGQDFFQDVIYNHNYQDLLVYGLDLGADPDVYPFWHSSQTDIRSVFRLNLAEYNSLAADRVLEAGRSRSQPDIRRQRYQEFQRIWQADAASLGLYRLELAYYTLKGVRGPAGQLVNKRVDLTRDVDQWTVLVERQRLSGYNQRDESS